MKKCVVKMLNGEPVGILYKSKDKYDLLKGTELIKYLGRIDERLYGRKAREIPNIQNEGLSLIFINKMQGKNIRIENYRKTCDELFKIYTENRKQIKEDLKTEKIVKRTLAGVGIATLISIGAIALSNMEKSSGKEIDIEKTAPFDQGEIQKSNAEHLSYIESELEIEQKEFEDYDKYEVKGIITPVEGYTEPNEEEIDEAITEINTDELLKNEEVDAIVNCPIVNIDIEAEYDPGIEENLKELEDYIHEEGQKWGISDSLIRDIISQESSGGSLDNVGQLEWDVWADKPFEVYNFKNNRIEKVVFTNNPSKYQNKVENIITEQDLNSKKNRKAQVSEVCILMRYFLDRYKNNIGLAIQAYNRGEKNVNEFLAKTARAEGKQVDDIKNNDEDFSWIDYAWKYKGYTYFQYVVKHMGENEENGLNEPYTILYKDENGNIQTKSIQFQVQENSKTK